MICDLAEYYHVLDYEQLPPSTVAVLVSGLRGESRVFMKLSGLKQPINTLLLASLHDNIAISNYMLNYRFSGKRPKKPESIFEKFMEIEEEPSNKKTFKGVAFETPEELERYLKEGFNNG